MIVLVEGKSLCAVKTMKGSAREVEVEGGLLAIGTVAVRYSYFFHQICLMNKRNCKQQIITLPATKTICSDFARKSLQTLVTADDHSNLVLWAIGQEAPVQVISTGRSDSQVTTIRLGVQEEDLLVGTNRGTINVWDIQSGKLKFNLKGHTIMVSCFTNTPRDGKILASGANDTVIKLWDIRTRNHTATFKNHSTVISCLEISPDCAYLVSGSQDKTAKLWDIRMQKLNHTYTQHQAPVNCASFNPDRMLFATGGSDRTAKQWEISDHFNCVSSTKTQTTPVTAILFTEDGTQIFTASNDSLKLWDFEQIQAGIVDNIQSSWKNVQHIFFDESKEIVYGLAFSSSKEFCLYNCPWKQLLPKKKLSRSGFDQDKRRQSPAKKGLVAGGGASFHQIDFKGLANKIDSVVENAKKNIRKDKQDRIDIQKREQQERKAREVQQRRNKEMQRLQKEEQLKRRQMEQRRIRELNQKKKKQLQEVQHRKIADQMIDRFQDNYNEEDNIRSTDLTHSINFSEMYPSSNGNKEVFQQFDIINQITKEHNKLVAILQERARTVRPIINWWKLGQLTQAMRGLSQIEQVQFISDILQHMLKADSRKSISIQVAIILIKKAVAMFVSGHLTYIKRGIQFLQSVVDIFKDQLVKVFSFAPMGAAVDLARDQRLARYRLLLQQMRKVTQLGRMKKILSKESESERKMEASQLARCLYESIMNILKNLSP